MGLSSSVWASDVPNSDDSLFITAPIIPEEKFIAGFYTNPEKINHIKIITKEDISNYKAICNKAWSMDYKLLKSLNANCVETQSWETLVRMLNADRGDFILAPFQANESMVLTAFGIDLLPIQGIKTHLPDDRVFIVSKKTKNSKAWFAALKKGLEILHEKGSIERAYTESGFYNVSTKDWQMIIP